ncbi:Gfo/Idh/MocA family protein [Leifsonia sp. NPDC056824]|uniref:Gfo/Idh/MocA family protein n=1 Tax=Leifsonia sp. NPDC056824 TaxID=3345953 RepID=UPI0036C7B767
MRNEPLGVAVVGCGNIGRTHANTALECEELRVVALVDPVPASADALADTLEQGGHRRPATYQELSEALADPAVDLVVVATPSGLHIEQSLAVLAAGKHLIVEKPLDVDLTRAQEIEKAALAAAERGVISSVISQRRFDPASVVITKALKADRFGRLTSAVATLPWWRSQGYYDSGDWRGTWAMDGGGALMNQGVHTMDLLLSFLGRPVEIYARTGLLAHDRVEVEDTAVATIAFESGALAVLHATTAAYPALPNGLHVMGTTGSARIFADELEYFHAAGEGDDIGQMGFGWGFNPTLEGNQADEELQQLGAPLTVSTHSASLGHLRQYRDVLSAIENGTQPVVRVSDAVLALAAVRAVYLSATLGVPVDFDEVVSGKFNDVVVATGS